MFYFYGVTRSFILIEIYQQFTYWVICYFDHILYVHLEFKVPVCLSCTDNLSISTHYIRSESSTFVSLNLTFTTLNSVFVANSNYKFGFFRSNLFYFESETSYSVLRCLNCWFKVNNLIIFRIYIYINLLERQVIV